MQAGLEQCSLGASVVSARARVLYCGEWHKEHQQVPVSDSSIKARRLRHKVRLLPRRYAASDFIVRRIYFKALIVTFQTHHCMLTCLDRR